ncbi:hypothetical protein JCM17844_10530 [Iodidimonas gelatinilytica]|uniref:Ribosome-binding factor A n=2 Tax=Iodidimonas gelatinilytica TaxID=1236966 RepID=A0A5A7N1J7_9PROT|nr:hypothetical protein JCM17844_10530 [Iodidimonas gelatinilytica]GER02142.1 hypothetical protein JCM17845_27650 [Iodidimonas gelatinilytica]
MFVVPLMGADAEAVLKGLSRAAPHFRGLLARQLTLKYLPQLHFKLDESFGEGDRIETILRSDKVRRDLDQADTLDDGNDEDAPA